MTSSKSKSKARKKSPYMTEQQVDTMITNRLILFHQGLVDHGQIKPLEHGPGWKAAEVD